MARADGVTPAAIVARPRPQRNAAIGEGAPVRGLYAGFMPAPALPHRFLTARALPASQPENQEASMLDAVMLLIAAALFAATIGYAYACDRI